MNYERMTVKDMRSNLSCNIELKEKDVIALWNAMADDQPSVTLHEKYPDFNIWDKHFHRIQITYSGEKFKRNVVDGVYVYDIQIKNEEPVIVPGTMPVEEKRTETVDLNEQPVTAEVTD